MRNKGMIVLSLAALLLCAGCTVSPVETGGANQGEYEVWFPLSEEVRQEENWGSADSGALEWEFRSLPEGEETVEGLMDLLFSGPEEPGLRSPFPGGTYLRGWSLEEGRLTLDLSETYGGLAGVDLTLADGCIVLTLSQLEEVEEVYITVEGRHRPFRDQVYTRADFIENNRLDLLPPLETEEPPSETEETDAEESGVPEE